MFEEEIITRAATQAAVEEAKASIVAMSEATEIDRTAETTTSHAVAAERM